MEITLYYTSIGGKGGEFPSERKESYQGMVQVANEIGGRLAGASGISELPPLSPIPLVTSSYLEEM